MPQAYEHNKIHTHTAPTCKKYPMIPVASLGNTVKPLKAGHLKFSDP